MDQCELHKLEFVWACGVFEGEGTILNWYDSNVKRHRRRLSMEMTDLDVIERVYSAFGCGSIKGPLHRGKNKPRWKWSCENWLNIEPLLREMLPYLGIRRRAAAEALLANPPKRATRGKHYVEHLFAS